MELLYEHTLRKEIAEQKAQIGEQKAQIGELTDMMRQMMATMQAGGAIQAAGDGVIPVAGNGQLIGQQVGNNNAMGDIVVINCFGNEDTSHLTRDHIKTILDGCRGGGAATLPAAANEAIMRAAMLIFSDPDRPENITCYLPNKKGKDVLVHGPEGWNTQSVVLAMTEMARHSIEKLFDLQPFTDAELYEEVMANLRDNEDRYARGADLRPVLIRNRELLHRVLGSLPRSLT